MPSAKICDLSTAATLDAAIAGGASHVGFVFFGRSPRDVAPERAGSLATPAGVGRVGIFVDPDDAALRHAVAAARLTAVQLHGGETPERLASLRTSGVELWKAIPVRTAADLAAAASYGGVADRILYDAKTPPGTLPGGMGLRFDWTLLRAHRHPLPWALSGGLDAGNVAEAVRVTGATLVDVSSGVESTPGVKDVDRIAAFCQALARS